MDRVVQVLLVVGLGYIFQIMMQVMGQKQIGSIIKICVWAIAIFMFINLVTDAIAWIDLKTQPIQEFIERGYVR